MQVSAYIAEPTPDSPPSPNCSTTIGGFFGVFGFEAAESVFSIEPLTSVMHCRMCF
jgi:hypothetical protein